MNLFKSKKNSYSVLTTDFSKHKEDIKNWQQQREIRMQTFQKYGEMIAYLESVLGLISDLDEQKKVQRQIKKIKSLQKNYIVPSIIGVKLELDQGKVFKKEM